MQKNVEQDAELCEKICQGLSSSHNVVSIGLSPFLYTSKNIINFAFYICYQINVTHYRNLKSFLPLISDESKYLSVIWI